MAKKAIQTLRRGDDGRMKLVYLDLETQQPIEYKDIGGYEIVTAEGGSYWNPNFTSPPKQEEVETTPKTKRLPYSSERNGTQGVHSGDKGKGNTNPIDNFGYFDKPKWMKAAAMIPGKIGAAAKLANVAVNANNTGAVNRAREMIELPPLKGKDALKSAIKDQQGQVANVYINNEDYQVGFEALSPSGNTNLTPNEARQRGLALGGLSEGVSPVSTGKGPEEKGKKKGFIEKVTGLGEGWLGDFLDKKFGKDEKGTDKPITPTEKKVLQTGGKPWGGDMPIGKQKDDIYRAPKAEREITPGLGLANLAGAAGRASFQESYGGHRPNRPDEGIISLVQESVTASLGPGYKVIGTSGTEGPDLPQYGTRRHKTGNAIDIQIQDPTGKPLSVKMNREQLAEVASQAAFRGAKGIGVGSNYMGGNHMHIDTVDPNPALGEGHQWGNLGKSLTDDLSFSRTLGEKTRDPNRPHPSPAPRGDPLSLDPVGQSLDPTAANQGNVFDRIGPKGTFSRQAVSDVPTSFVGSTPARIAALGMTPRTPDQVERMSRALAGELSPEQLKSLEAGDPIAQRELANMVTTVENRAASAKYGTLEGALNPSQYNSLMTGNLDVTNGNYGIYGSTLSKGINDYYTGALKPDNYDFTSYYNEDLSNPSWGPGMSDRQKVGDHTFGALPEYGPSSEFRDKTGLLSGSNRPTSLGSDYNKGSTPHSIERERDTSLRESSGKNSLMSSSNSSKSNTKTSNYKESSSSSKSSNPSHSVERERDKSVSSSNNSNKSQSKTSKETKSTKESRPGSERF